jgi:hypothetical protein
MIVSGSVVRFACDNNYVNMIITGQIVGVGLPVTIYNNILNGGTTAPFSATFTAPSTTGSKTFRVIANTYSPAFYLVELTDGGGYFSAFTIVELEKQVPINYFYHSGSNSFINNNTGEHFTLFNVPNGEQVLTTTTIDITFTVVAPPTVDVTVDTVDGPITKNVGDSVAVTWTSKNASSCTCQCQDGSGNAIDCGATSTRTPKSNCGNDNPVLNIGRDVESIPKIITNILRPTTFKVTCN